MKRPVMKLTVLAAVVYLSALVALFPAALAVRWFVPEVPGLALGAADGTVWNGQLASVAYRGWNLGNAEWSLKPLSLFGLAIAADVQLQRHGSGPMTATVHATPSGRTTVTALRGVVTLTELARARLMPANIANGEIILNIDTLELQDGRPVAAEGRIGLTGLQSTLLPGVALGSYESEVETTDTGVRAVFHEREAPLRIAGQAQLQPDGRYTVSGSITPTPETPEGVKRGLMLLGQPDASGRYEFGFSGRL